MCFNGGNYEVSRALLKHTHTPLSRIGPHTWQFRKSSICKMLNAMHIKSSTTQNSASHLSHPTLTLVERKPRENILLPKSWEVNTADDQQIYYIVLEGPSAIHVNSLPPCLRFLEPFDFPDPPWCPSRFLPPLPLPPPPADEASSSPPSADVSVFPNHTGPWKTPKNLTLNDLARPAHQVQANLPTSPPHDKALTEGKVVGAGLTATALPQVSSPSTPGSALSSSQFVLGRIYRIETSLGCICRKIIMRAITVVPLNSVMSAAVFEGECIAHLGGMERSVRARLLCNLQRDLVDVVRVFDTILLGLGCELLCLWQTDSLLPALGFRFYTAVLARYSLSQVVV